MERLKLIPGYSVYLFLVYMPLHIFLSQSISLLTGGLSVWKVAKDVFLGLIVLLTVFLVYYQKKANKFFNRLMIFAGLYLVLHFLMWALHVDIYERSALLAIIYNNRILWMLIIGAGAAILTPELMRPRKLIKVTIGISSVVAFLGVVQYFLPQDILTHLGYSIERGVKPNFAIDDKSDLPRIMSTIRDPNSLGAYLIVPIALLASKLIRKTKNFMLVAGLLMIHVLALFLTFSRAAWVGAAVAVVALVFIQAREFINKHKFQIGALAIVVTFLLGVFVFVFRDQYVVQNIIFHSDENTVAELDSNELHVNYVVGGLQSIFTDPLGYGPGTAGIVSINNPGGGLLTENYYVQIAHEVSILGLIILVAVLFILAKKLYVSKEVNLAPALFAALIGYVLMGFVMHLWSNEAVAAQWWLLVGVTLALPKKTK